MCLKGYRSRENFCLWKSVWLHFSLQNFSWVAYPSQHTFLFSSLPPGSCLHDFHHLNLVQSFSHPILITLQFSHSVMSNSVTPWTAGWQDSLSINSSWILFKLMSIKSVMSSNHLILCCPFLFLLSIFPSIRVFSNESVLRIRWPNYWEFQLHHQSFQWIFRIDFHWTD